MDALVPVRRVQELDLAVSGFCAVLTDQQRRDLSGIRTIPDADSIFVFTAQLDYKNRSRRGQSVGSRVSKILQSTRDFCTVIDTFASSHPEIAALVWGSVKLTIQIVLNYTSYYEAISSLFMQLGRLCPLFAEYGALYPSSERLQNSLSNFHASIVRCCKHVIEAIQRPWHGRVLQAFYRSFEQEFQPDVDDIRRCSDSVKDAINLAKEHVDAEERKLQAKERTTASKHRDLLEAVLKRQSHDRKQKLLEIFCSHRPERLLKQNQRKRFSDTASWIFETAEFRSWFGTSDSPFLLCSGKIGSGKTVVAASVVDYLFLEKGRSDCFVSYFFVHSSDQDSLRADTIMKSLLRQRLPQAAQLTDKTEERLRNLGDDSDLSEIVTFLRDITYESGPSYIVIDGLDECEKRERVRLLQALSSLVATAANTKLFLAGRESLMEEIKTRFTATQQISMDNPGAYDDMVIYIHGILRDKIDTGELRVGDSDLIMEIENALNQGADGMFLWVFFQVQELCEQTCDEDIRHAIANLPEDLEETFRRVLRRISSRNNSELAQRVLPWIAAAVRPLFLEEIREAIAVEIGQQYTKTERLCNNVNSIISSCENLLHMDEEDGSVQFAHHSIKQFLIEQPVSPQQFTDHEPQKFHINMKKADHFIGEICVTYLYFSDFQTALGQPQKPIVLPNPNDIARTALGPKWKLVSKLGRRVQSRGTTTPIEANRIINSIAGSTSKAIYNDTHPFLEYAAINWILHTKNFRDNRSKTWNLWKKIVISGHTLAITPWPLETSDGDTHIHEWAIQARHRALMRLIGSYNVLWIPTGWHVICDSVRDNTPAIGCIGLRCRKPDKAASYIFPEHPTLSSLDIADRLLEVGADVSGTNWDTKVLEDASHNGYLYVVEMLLQTNQPLVDFAKAQESILIKGVRYGRIDIVSMILKRTNVQHESWGLRVALYEAAGNGRLDIIETILSEARVEDIGREAQLAFIRAAANGYSEIVERLLTVGVKINGKSTANGTTALEAAAAEGHLDIVERLLAAGADINSKDRMNSTALHQAATYGHTEIVEMLIAGGADIHVRDKEAETALGKASKKGNFDIVEKLLFAGASKRPRRTGTEVDDATRLANVTALHKAATDGHIDIIEKLIVDGVDVHARDEEGETALDKAVKLGYYNIVELLVLVGG